MKSKKILVLFGVLFLSLSSIHGVKAETEYENSDSSVSYASGTVSSDSNEDCQVSVSQTSTFSVTIPKYIVLNGAAGETNDAEYDVNVTANIASDEKIVVEPPENFEMKDNSGIKTKTATITQPAYVFVEDETKSHSFSQDSSYVAINRASEGEDGTALVEGTVAVENLTAGEWSGTFSFNIELTAVSQQAAI